MADFERLSGFDYRQTDRQTDICNCRVAFETEKIQIPPEPAQLPNLLISIPSEFSSSWEVQNVGSILCHFFNDTI